MPARRESGVYRVHHGMNQRITIVGGGIVGAACARTLTQAGAHVTVVEARFPGGGATAAGMGHVVVMDDSPAQLAITTRSRELWHTLAEELPAEAEWRRTGTLWVAADDDELAEACKSHIAQYKIPKAFIRVDKVMRSPSGKADYRWAKSVAAGQA